MIRKTIRSNIFLLALLCLVALLSGCKGGNQTKEQQKKVQIVTAKMETPVTKLFFNGSIQPISKLSVVSPVDGRIAELKFTYGRDVKKGQELSSISSTQLADKYRKAVTDYLQKKDTYANGIESYQGSEALYRAGVVSKEAYLTAKNQYENNVLSFFQAKFELEKLLKKVNIDPTEIEKLTIGKTKAVNKILRRRFSHIVVNSPGSGVALFPTPDQTTGTGDEKQSGKLIVGSQVKTGQLMLTIGDLSGLSVQVKVSEINVNRIKPGMSVIVTGDAFPDIKLKGKVMAVASQADPDQSGGGAGSLSMFNISIKIAKITVKQRKVIHVGMTAKIEIDIKKSPRIMLPIKAVIRKKGQNTVTVVGALGARKSVIVQVGETTPDGKIAILKGLKSGDKVVVHD